MASNGRMNWDVFGRKPPGRVKVLSRDLNGGNEDKHLTSQNNRCLGPDSNKTLLFN
jgi:hypothetical protein